MQRRLPPKVIFVVVNWNQRALTLDCMASLASQQYSNFGVILVDNGSTDGSVTAIRQAFPEVTVIGNPYNIGIAAANNIGIRHAMAGGADFVFLLNNDTVVDPEMLNLLVTSAQGDGSIGATGPTMLYFDESETIWCAGNRIDWRTGDTFRLDAEAPFRAVADTHPRQVDYITSCAVCIKRAVFEDVGLMDERYFIYYDETDWFVRASSSGWRFLHVPEAKIWHKVSAAMGTTSPATDYYMNRNVLLFLAKNQQGLARWQSLLLAASRNLLAVAAYTAKPHGGQRLPNRNARLLALRDAVLRRWGKMGADVAKVCYSEHR